MKKHLVALTAAAFVLGAPSAVLAEHHVGCHDGHKCEKMDDGKMKCCKKDKDGKMACEMMDAGKMDHSTMDHSNMDTTHEDPDSDNPN
ncbi:MAG: hypothetical protein V7676_09985 [Parasphingorhabdus sp.]|uniref:hypothetical protein n=1 Tax=Parasphingorhabdus sp. TaxID=2709688 RepID=UPI003000FC14